MGKTHRHSSAKGKATKDSHDHSRGTGGTARMKHRPFRKHASPHNYHSVEERHFQTYLNSQGLTLYEIPGDGNCLFRSISHQLHRNEEQHLDIRKLVAAFLSSHWQDYVYYVIDEDAYASNASDLAEMTMEDMKEQYEDYVKEMRQDGTRGSQLELVAITQAFQVHIVVYQPNAPTYILHAPNVKEPVRYLQVSFHGDCHYNSIVGPVPPSLLISSNSTSSASENVSSTPASSSTPSSSGAICSVPKDIKFQSPELGEVILPEVDLKFIQQSLSWVESHHVIYVMYVLLQEEDVDLERFRNYGSDAWKDLILDFVCQHQEEVKDYSCQDVRDLLPDGYSSNVLDEQSNESNACNEKKNEVTYKQKKKKPVVLSKKEQRKLEKQQLAKQKQQLASSEDVDELASQIKNIVL